MRASLIQIGTDDVDAPPLSTSSAREVPPDPVRTAEVRRDRATALVGDAAAQGADLVVLPELWTVGAFAYESFATAAEPLRGPTYEAMAKAASEAGVWLHAGSIPERAAPDGDSDAPDGDSARPDGDSAAPDGGSDAGGGTLYNTSLVFAPDGSLAASYRKIHRFGFDKGEAVLMGAGSDLVTVRMAGATAGLATCYDLRFPEMFRALADRGAELLVVPAGWPERRRAHWTLLARARAVENQAYVLACGSAGTHAGVPQAGHSIAVDPWGTVLGEAGHGEEILTVDLDMPTVATTRERFPALKDRVLGLAAPGAREP